MGLSKSKSFFIYVLILLALFGVSLGGTVHKVGDSEGWTMTGVDYAAWASSRTFKVGDSLFFDYNKNFHDVIQVTHKDFGLCKPSPLAKYKTGSDTITLTKPGLQHFICGVSGHCDLGQKLQIHVLPASLGTFAPPVTFLNRSDHQARVRLLPQPTFHNINIRWLRPHYVKAGLDLSNL